MTPVGPLHKETKVPPLHQHNHMLSLRYMHRCYPAPRRIRKDLSYLRVEREVQRYKREPLRYEDYRAGQNSIHTDAVADFVNH